MTSQEPEKIRWEAARRFAAEEENFFRTATELFRKFSGQHISPLDFDFLDALYEKRVRVEELQRGIEQSFIHFRKRCPTDHVRSFRYCYPAILEEWEKRQ